MKKHSTKPRVSILTPSWNRAKLLPKVHDSLEKQTEQNFEWIVVDDGSDDDTQEVMNNLLETATFPTIFSFYKQRVGKCRADNTLLDLSNSDKILWCDSDDVLIPEAIEIMLEVWDSILENEKNNYIAVIALCSDPSGNFQNTGNTKFDSFTCSWEDLMKVHGMSGDMCIMVNSCLVGNARFLEVDLVMPESGFWKQFMSKKVVCIQYQLKIVTRTTKNRISGSNRMEYCRGKAFSILLADKIDYPDKSVKNRVRIASNLIRYSIHGDLKLREIENKFGTNSSYLTFKIGKVIGAILALKDRLQGRVYKSHIVFEKSRDEVANTTLNKIAKDD